MKKNFFVLIEQDEDGFYTAIVPELQGCHTQASSIDELMNRTKEVIGLCLEESQQANIKQMQVRQIEVECA